MYLKPFLAECIHPKHLLSHVAGHMISNTRRSNQILAMLFTDKRSSQ